MVVLSADLLVPYATALVYDHMAPNSMIRWLPIRSPHIWHQKVINTITYCLLAILPGLMSLGYRIY